MFRSITWFVTILVSLAAAATPLTASDPSVETGVRSLLFARAFTLDTPTTFQWTASPFEYSRGFIVVLEVDPTLAQPRQTDVAVLYAGALPVEIVNGANPDHRVVGIVPNVESLAATEFFYGSTQLPERTTPEDGRAQQAEAVATGASPFTSEAILVALDETTLEAGRLDDVYREIGNILSIYSPTETDLIEACLQIP